MISFERFTLPNGLKVLFHQDTTTPIAAINVLYKVGARDEDPEKTGLAHLFEHLMFGGSKHIKNFDKALQEAGGSCNAFTNNDYTNYYITIPKENIETALWLESDRMKNLILNQKRLDIQKKVVIEEFKQNYLNRPYGDYWLILRPLAYKVHPYSWAAIGKSIDHIQNMKPDDVSGFYKSFYTPQNSILSISGNFKLSRIKSLCEKWFSDINSNSSIERFYLKEPKQSSENSLIIEREVPFNSLFKAFHMCNRKHEDYHTTDLISDILSNGDSSRLYQKLFKEKSIFTSIDAFITGSYDNGLFVVSGKLNKGISYEHAENELGELIDNIKTSQITERELQKVKNKAESKCIFSETDILNKSVNLAYYEFLGDADLVNQEICKYNSVKTDSILKVSNTIFKEENTTTLYYKSKQQN